MTQAQAKFTEEKVLWVKRHTPKLVSFALSRPAEYRFSAGQFSRLGVREGEGFLWRAYSVVSAEYADDLEYFAVLIDDGPMSRHLAALKEGDTLLLDKTATGFLLPERFVDGSELVMLSTGSGIAPFLSILENPAVWTRFTRLALAHSVSHADELVFNERIEALKDHPLVGEFADKLVFQPVVTREAYAGALGFRLPELIRSGRLEEAFGFAFTHAQTRLMLCGNPAMVADTFKALLDKGFAMHRNKIPGQILMENGF